MQTPRDKGVEEMSRLASATKGQQRTPRQQERAKETTGEHSGNAQRWPEQFTSNSRHDFFKMQPLPEDTLSHDKNCLVPEISTPGVIRQLLPSTRRAVGPPDIPLDALRNRFQKLRHPSIHKRTKWLQCSVLCSRSTSGANIRRKQIYTRKYKAKRSLASPKSALGMLQTGPEHAKQHFDDFRIFKP